MQIITNRLHPDEPAYGIFEGPVRGRWLQYVFVVRGDAIAKYTTDLGPVSQYERVTIFMMPSDGDDTVAELRAYAEKNRHDFYWANRRDEMLAGSTLISDVINQLGQRKNRLYAKRR